jgi:hypothetical protein
MPKRAASAKQLETIQKKITQKFHRRPAESRTSYSVTPKMNRATFNEPAAIALLEPERQSRGQAGAHVFGRHHPNIATPRQPTTQIILTLINIQYRTGVASL